MSELAIVVQFASPALSDLDESGMAARRAFMFFGGGGIGGEVMQIGAD